MAPNTMLFTFGSSASFELALDGKLARSKKGFELEILTICISQAQLPEIFGCEELAVAFEKRLKDDGAPKPVYWNIPQAVGGALRSCGAPESRQRYEVLEMRAGLCEYLRLLLIHSAKRDRRDNTAIRQAERIQKIHGDLLNLGGAMPKLDDLANDYGKSLVTLNKEFSAAYGKTIFEFASDRRWEKARIEVLAGTPIKKIAGQAGFENVGNFNAAFRKRFGQPPGQFRKFERPKQHK